MATDRDYTDPFLTTYVPPPPTALGVCDVCHGPALSEDGTEWSRCYSCKQSRAVRHPTDLVVPISLTHKSESQLYEVLYRYKGDRPILEHRAQVAALLVRFLNAHRSCISGAAGRDWDTITVVPSTRGRPAHPLEQAIALAPTLGAELDTLLDPGPGTIGRNAPANDGYVARDNATGKSVLIVDDTFATGSHLQSAASALADHGAAVVGAVVIGRLVDTNWDVKRTFWDERRRTPFSFDTCCLESGA